VRLSVGDVRLHPLLQQCNARLGRGAGRFIWVHAADQQGEKPLGVILCDAKTDPSSHRVAQVVCVVHLECIQHRQHIFDPVLQGVGLRIVKLIALPMPSGINQNELVILPQGSHIPIGVPVLQTAGKAMLQDEWWPLAFHLVVNADAVIVGIGHGYSFLSEIEDTVRDLVVYQGIQTRTRTIWQHNAHIQSAFS